MRCGTLTYTSLGSQGSHTQEQGTRNEGELEIVWGGCIPSLEGTPRGISIIIKEFHLFMHVFSRDLSQPA